MNEYSFVGWAVSENGCELQLPISDVNELRFFIPEELRGELLSGINIVDIEGDFIRACEYDFADGWVSLKNTSIDDLTCFKFDFYYPGSLSTPSNLFRYFPIDKALTDTTLLKYKCYEPQFGFDYSIAGSYNQLRLPILLREPQFNQDDSLYTDANGVGRVLSSIVVKEYTLETEYIPEDWHEKLVIALSHDEVWIEGLRLQRSAPYEINYDEFDELPCGTRLYKASAKLKYNTAQRNTNC